MRGGLYDFHGLAPDAKPPNVNVNEEAFRLLKQGEPKADVLALLGTPHDTTAGTIVQIERPIDPVMHYGICESIESQNPLLVFRGVNDENIRVVFVRQADCRRILPGKHGPAVHRRPVSYERPGMLAIDSERLHDSPLDAPSKDLQLRIDAFRKKLFLRRAAELASRSRPIVIQQPARPEPVVKPKSVHELRTWTDASGRHKTEAEFLGLHDGLVRMRKSDGKIVDVALRKLSDGDQDFVVQAANEPGAAARMALSFTPPAVSLASRIEPGPVASRAASRPASFRIKLPSGKLLTESIPKFELPQPWPDNVFPGGASVCVARESGDAIRGVITLGKAKMQGPSATLYHSGRLESLAYYNEGKLHGPLRVWTDQQERLLYAEYLNGKKNGLICFFQAGMPWLIQEWEKASLAHQYLVQYVDQSPTVTAVSQLTGADAEEFTEAKRQLTDLEKTLSSHESDFRKRAADWIRKEQREAKQSQNATVDLELQWRTALSHSRL